ncbi:MAG: hypothetical protein A2Y67_01460 [Candidatus Buchananbacteria bacterium RBG_13_39_9]|uniref:Uncharacterized protein n=1 Tax=Candidatus Buchananbacteria bacterium RBG_13_39_9 TaxID=1797531 RepID=A0A1G1XRW3_9BACT|nr:MAG: hypothetical protein A2Y67_01460 [Candidatus Buchananbacteria bacterium RBG_13_39_9]
MMDEFIFGCLCLIVIFFVYGILLPMLMIAIPACVCSFIFDDACRRAFWKRFPGKLNFKSSHLSAKSGLRRA